MTLTPMLDNDTLVKALNYRFETLSWMLPVESRVFRKVTKKYGVKGGWVQWRPNVTAANGSMDWDTSQTYQNGPVPLEAKFDFREDYAPVTVLRKTYLATEGDGAAEPAPVMATKGAVKEHTLSAANQLRGNGGGSRALVSANATVASDTLLLDNPEDARYFLQDMWVQAANDDGSGSSPGGLLAGGAATQIIAPRVYNGSIKTKDGSNWNALIPGITAGTSYLFRRGDYAKAWNGLGAWFPRTTPTAGDAFGSSVGSIDRSVNPDKLCGLLISSGLPGNNIVEAIFNIREAMDVNMDVDDESATRMLTVVMGNANVKKLMDSVQLQTRYGAGDKAQLGAGEYIFKTPWGDMEVLAEPGFAKNDILIGDLASFELHIIESDMPKWFDLDGKVWHYTSTKGDALEAFIGSNVTTRCSYPSRFARGILPATGT